MDWALFCTILGSAATIIGAIYQFLRNFKADVDKRFELVDKRFESVDKRFESFERKFDLLENRIFQIAMGKSLKKILQEERK